MTCTSNPEVKMRARRHRQRRLQRKLAVEHLEMRRLLHAEGLAWTDAPDLTLSFVPDGTEVGPYTSDLFSSMESLGPANQWQDKVTEAFRMWAGHANAAVRVVGDSGDALGALGVKQGDVRFGDVRVASVPLADDVIAISVPNDEIVSGTWSGDVLFNSNVDLASLDELYAVSVHEAGHVFGLGHSADPLSPMARHGIPDQVVPTAKDILELQGLYGVPLADRQHGDGGGDDDHTDEHEAEEHSNDLMALAVPITITPYFSGAVRYDGAGRISAADDVDFFHLAPAAEQFEPFDVMTVTVRSVGVDRLAPHAEVYSAEGELKQAEILVNGDGELVLQLTGADPDHDYFLKVGADQYDSDYQVGAYQFTVQFGQRGSVVSGLGDGTVKPESNRVEDTLNVPESGLVHLILSVKETEAVTDAVVWAAVYDDQDAVVYQVAALPGQTHSGASVLLNAGTYHIEVVADSPSGSELPELTYELTGAATSLPIGPGVTDPTGTPILPCNTAGADPKSCLPPSLVVGDPAVFPSPLPKPPAPVVRVDPPWLVPGRWFWNATNRSANAVPAANAWHNPGRPTDVNSDGLITPIDALMVVNYLNSSQSALLPARPPTAPLIDVTNDGYVTPLDALRVVNLLNQPAGGGEGEFAGTLQPAATSAVAAGTVELVTVDASWWDALGMTGRDAKKQASDDSGAVTADKTPESVDQLWAMWI